MRSGVIEELPFPALAYRFTHELVRRALYDRLSVLRRAELHLRIAEALESVERPRHGTRARRPGPPFRSGGADRRTGAGGRVQPARGASGVGRAGLRRGQRPACARRCRWGWRTSASAPRSCSTSARRCSAPAARSTRCRRFARRRRSRESSARESCSPARRSGSRRPAGGRDSPTRAPASCSRRPRRCSRAEDSTLRVGLLASLARALEFEGDSDRAAAARADAIAMARRIDDRPGLATVLMGVYWARATTSLARGSARCSARHAIWPRSSATSRAQAEATQWRVSALMALGEIVPAREELAVALEMAQHTRQPFILHVAEHYRSALALLEGRLAEAEAAAERSREWGRLLVGRDASSVYGIQMFGVRREQGRLAELAPVIRVLAAGDRAGGAWRPGLAAMLAELAMEEQVRSELDRVHAEGLEPLREGLWLASLTYLADAASAVAHEEVAALVYPMLAPLTGTNVMIGHGVACYGAADRYLGMLAATLGDTDGATRHFEAALQLNRQMGASTWLAHTAYEYGRMLLRRGDPDRGEQLLAEAALLAETAGMPTLARACPRPHADIELAASRRPLRRASSRCFAWWRAVAPTARSEPRCSSASTPPPTMSAASCARPRVRTGPRRRRTPTGAVLRRTERALASSYADVRDRARIRRTARAHERRREADRGGQRRRGRPLAVLVPQRRPAPLLLPLRGTVTRHDQSRRQAR